jgi:hypothetical protein
MTKETQLKAAFNLVGTKNRSAIVKMARKLASVPVLTSLDNRKIAASNFILKNS